MYMYHPFISDICIWLLIDLLFLTHSVLEAPKYEFFPLLYSLIYYLKEDVVNIHDMDFNKNLDPDH